MATKSKVVENAFRLGAGRYIQENGATSLVGEEVTRLGGKKPFVMGGKTALSLTADKIERSLADSGTKGVFYTYEGFCSKEHCADIQKTQLTDCDVIVGVGGGNVCDAAKLLAANAGLPVITVPTSSATCAAYTPLSVCYNDVGQTVGTVHHKCEVNCVLADMDILCRQPVRLALAGIYDALAKIYEINQRLLGKNEEDIDIGLMSSYKMSLFACDFLDRNKEQCCKDIAEGKDTKIVYDVIYIAIALTGVISGLARGSNQTAIAHKIYETSRSLFPREVYDFLHGEMVAIGLIAQIYYNGEGNEKDFANTMRSFGMPTSIHALGLPETEETLMAYYEKIVASSAMAGTSDEEKQKLAHALKIIL